MSHGTEIRCSTIQRQPNREHKCTYLPALRTARKHVAAQHTGARQGETSKQPTSLNPSARVRCIRHEQMHVMVLRQGKAPFGPVVGCDGHDELFASVIVDIADDEVRTCDVSGFSTRPPAEGVARSRSPCRHRVAGAVRPRHGDAVCVARRADFVEGRLILPTPAVPRGRRRGATCCRGHPPSAACRARRSGCPCQGR